MNDYSFTYEHKNICPICKKVRVYLISTASNPPIYRYECGCGTKEYNKPGLGEQNGTAK